MRKVLAMCLLVLFWHGAAFASYSSLEVYESSINDGQGSVKTFDTYSSPDYVEYSPAGQVFYSRTHSTTPITISLGPDDSVSYATGYADSANMNMGAKSSVISNSNLYYASEAQITSNVRNSFTIMPEEDSGVQNGDIVSVRLSYRVDGSYHASDRGDDSSFSPWASMSYDFKIKDPSLRIDTGEGFMTPDLLELRGGGTLQGGIGYISINPNWEERLLNPDTGWTEQVYYWYDYPEWYSSSATYNFDTGQRNLFFDVIVGNEIEMEGSLETWIQSYFTTDSQVDFLNTFGVDLFSTMDGTYIEWNNPPTESSAVPIPGAVWLLGSGLLGLAGLRRKIKK